MIWLFKNTPREALGEEALALHDLFAENLVQAKRILLKTKSRKVPDSPFVVDAIARHGDTLISYCVPRRYYDQPQINEMITPRACLTIALACAADGCNWLVIQEFLSKFRYFSVGREWVLSGGLHLAATMIDAKPEFMGLLAPKLVGLNYSPKGQFDTVYKASILSGMESLKLSSDANESAVEGLSFRHLALCRGGYLELPEESRDADLQVAIDSLKRIKGFDSHEVNGHSANLRDLMRLMVFNAGFMLMLRKASMKTIEQSLRPVFNSLMAPYGLRVEDVDFLWRRAQLCLYSPFPEYYNLLQPDAGELFGGDQARAKTLFRQIGVHIDQMDSVVVLKKGLGILYDPKYLVTSNRAMPGWSTPLDAFAQGFEDYSLPAVAMLRMLDFEKKSPGLKALCAGRINEHQLVVYLIAQGGYDAWLEHHLVESPHAMPPAFVIESVFPALRLEKFSVQAQRALVMLYAEFTFKSFFRVKSPYNQRRLEEAVQKFRENTDSSRKSIPGFSVTMIRGMKDAQVISDEIMRDLEFSGGELSLAGVGSSGLNIDDLLAKDLGL